MEIKNAKVRYNDPVGPSCYKLGLDAGYDREGIFPGRFVMVQVPGQTDLLLRRPFSIYNFSEKDPENQVIEILYKIVGKGTEKLSHIHKGEILNLLGPLGKGFTLPDKPGEVFLIAGGIGIAPLYYLVLKMLSEKRWEEKNIVLFFGARSKPETALLADFNRLPLDVKVTTDDGSLGKKGLVTELLEDHLKKNHPDFMYACGPVPMLKTVASYAHVYEISCQVSLETIMACGMGACLGCAVKNRARPDKYDHVCVDGPVFDLKNFQF